MAEPTTDSSLEERRLALEERKFESEREARKQEFELKSRESSWLARLASPLTTTIGAGVLALFASIAGSFFQGRQTLELEREKFGFSKNLDTQKQQHELILKMISVGDVRQARTNLEFLAETGLISDKELAERLLKAKATPVLPVPSGSTPERLNKCDASPARAAQNTIQVGDASLYVESCVYPAEGGSYRYIYRVENKGSTSISNIRWESSGITLASLPPGQAYWSVFLASNPPSTKNTELSLGSNKQVIQAIIPSGMQ